MGGIEWSKKKADGVKGKEGNSAMPTVNRPLVIWSRAGWALETCQLCKSRRPFIDGRIETMSRIVLDIMLLL